jgi:hypothetical protein
MSKSLAAVLATCTAAFALAAGGMSLNSSARAAEPIIKVNPDVRAGKADQKSRAQDQWDKYMSGRKVQGSTGPTVPPKPTQGNVHR